jgi:ERCC4-type nuclease
MKIVIDEREHVLYEKCISILNTLDNKHCIQVTKEVLHIGDIIIRNNDNKDILIIERKTFNDLFASIKDGRYEEQSYRLLNSSGLLPHSIIYLLEGITSQLDKYQKKILYSTITSLQYFKGFSTQRTVSITDTAEWLIITTIKLLRKFEQNIKPYYLTEPFQQYIKQNSQLDIENNENEQNVFVNISETQKYCSVVKKVKKDNISRENIGEIILCQIPGISSITAITLMKEFNNFPDFLLKLRNDPNYLDNIYIENNGKKRKLSKTIIDNIKNYLIYTSDLLE